MPMYNWQVPNLLYLDFVGTNNCRDNCHSTNTRFKQMQIIAFMFSADQPLPCVDQPCCWSQHRLVTWYSGQTYDPTVSRLGRSKPVHKAFNTLIEKPTIHSSFQDRIETCYMRSNNIHLCIVFVTVTQTFAITSNATYVALAQAWLGCEFRISID